MKTIVVAGHVCLDIIPTFGSHECDISPGKLVDVGRAVLSTGGAVANTGLALNRLGVPVRLVGKIGGDLFGDAIASIFNEHREGLSDGLVRSESPTSYSIVISAPGTDRIFLHCPGANDTFGPEDLEPVAGASMFHFGYPTLMRRMFEKEGRELEKVLLFAKRQGLVTSLDVSLPDAKSDAGRAPWKQILERVLPQVDLFVPSVEEVLYMLWPYESMQWDRARLAKAADELIEMGAPVVMIKLGSLGIYLKTSADPKRLEFLMNLGCNVEGWIGKELVVPIFDVKVGGTTGCGDSAIAGFLAAVNQGKSPEIAIEAAAATGACSAEHPDATSGILRWDAMQERIQQDWKRKPLSI
jgi:sugar/nucleoside kinase (ribokinase family)